MLFHGSFFMAGRQADRQLQHGADAGAILHQRCMGKSFQILSNPAFHAFTRTYLFLFLAIIELTVPT
jgi:hypothetical protein